MSDRVLIDTNVLVYAVDTSEAVKCTQARRLLVSLESSGTAALSTQVLGEYCSVVLRRFRTSIPVENAARQAASWARVFPVHDVSVAVVMEALRGMVRYQLSYYDAQIWACARVNRIPVVLSEDFSDGAVIEGVRFVNPFAEGFPGLE